MAFFPGLKKQFNKANQFMSEKIGGVEGTKLNEEYTEMERKTDLTTELIDELIAKTKEYLQPNPVSRSKMMLSARGAQNTRVRSYPQPEGTMGETILKIAHAFGEDSPHVSSLMETGESFKQMAEIKYALEDDIRQDFLEPLIQLQNKDLREIQFHRKKLESRRLDFDCKKRRKAKGAHIVDEEMKIAEEKFEESFNFASQGMHNLLQNDVEQISQLVALVEALRDYHKECTNILDGLSIKLGKLRNDSAGRQHSQYVPKKLVELNPGICTTDGLASNYVNIEQNADDENMSSSKSELHTTGANQSDSSRKYGLCTAMYDFQAENAGELGFKEGQTLKLFVQIDENWYEGTIDGPESDGRTGLIPTNYVKVTQPIPARRDDDHAINPSN